MDGAGKYRRLWADMHTNPHHEDMDALGQWYAHARQVMDFWPVAYYPFTMRTHSSGLGLEDILPQAVRDADWEAVRDLVRRANEDGFPMFLGYEWQGAGEDGDHNVFFLDNDAPMLHPMRYAQLREGYRGRAAIAVPHHLAYQPGSRGKNWDTHDAQFSPIAELYSSHGSSENDTGPIGMNRHVHMGPRTGATCFERGLARGVRVGVIASGDNHSVPGVCEHGMMCALAASDAKADIWAALTARRTYGVSQSRIAVDFTVNGAPMGSDIVADTAALEFDISGSDAIDRVEILRDNIVEHTVVHAGTWERAPLRDPVRMKFEVRFGWGPDLRVYPDLVTRTWTGALRTKGRLLSVEKCWNSLGQAMHSVTEQGCDFSLTTHKSTTTGKWMGPSGVVTEGFVFEVETALDDDIVLTADGVSYPLAPRDLLATSRIIPLYEQAQALTRARWGEVTHYRDDPWWHNCYKIKVGQATPAAGYTMRHSGIYPVEGDCQYRLRVWQRNGHAAWTSPIFIRARRLAQNGIL